MIDLHCHLLPGVDDGPPTLEESIVMARAAYQDGVRAIVATPHARDWGLAHPGEDACHGVAELVRDLEQVLHQVGIPLALYPGMEIHLDPDLPEWLRSGRVCPLGAGPYFLLELPFFQPSPYLEQVISDVQLQGWRPVLAHAERYTYVQEAPDLLAPLVERGVLVQVTANSLTGNAGPLAGETAVRLLRRGLVHCLASDGHTGHASRAPLLMAGVQAAARVVGSAQARALVTEMPQQILDGAPVEVGGAVTRRLGEWASR